MKVNKPEDPAARTIEFGVEIETMIPLTSNVTVGAYHGGHRVRGGTAPNGEFIPCPTFAGFYWKAERDGSIMVEDGYAPCEFVSPILYGDAGLAALRDFIRFANRIGAKVNKSCGCHITVGIKSVIGTADAKSVASFVRKLAQMANQNRWAIYAQTGTDRHTNHYCHLLHNECEQYLNAMLAAPDGGLPYLASRCGRGMVNFQKAFQGESSAVEFRAFAGTLNEGKVLHHLATALGLCRKAHVYAAKTKLQKGRKNKSTNALDAVRRLWRILGWSCSTGTVEVALGLFGALHAEFGTYRKVAAEMAAKFEERFPAANL